MHPTKLVDIYQYPGKGAMSLGTFIVIVLKPIIKLLTMTNSNTEKSCKEGWSASGTDQYKRGHT